MALSGRTRAFRWRLLLSALTGAEFVESLREAITNFIVDNVGTVYSVATVWEAFKCTIRGHCIAHQCGVLHALRASLSWLAS